MISFSVLQRVNCPPDMGQPGYIGRVISIAENESSHIGKRFKWIIVERLDDYGQPTGQKYVWPSTRLSATN